MVKCERCNGSGIVHICEIPATCTWCDGTGMLKCKTNFEYLRECSLDEAATLIATKLLELAKKEYGICDVVDKKTIEQWLDEEHHE